MTNTMNYKGYYAKVEFDPRNDVFVGRVLGIEDSISFHGATVRELHTDFKAAIEHYLEDCARTGRKPQKQASGNILIRIAPELHATATVVAQAKGKSLNAWVVDAIKEHVNF